MPEIPTRWLQFDLGRLLFAILVVCVYFAFRSHTLTPPRILLAAVGIGAVSALYVGLFSGRRYSSLGSRLEVTTRWGGVGAFVATFALSLLLAMSRGFVQAAPWIVRQMVIFAILAATVGAIAGFFIGLACQVIDRRLPPPPDRHPLD